MRNLLSGVCLLLAGLLAAVSLAGAQVDQLLRTEEPVRQIAGDLPAQEQFSRAVAEIMISELSEHIPESIQGLLGGTVEAQIASAVEGIVDEERTRRAWDETLQITRSDYADQLETLFEEGSSGRPSELDLALDLSPVADSLTGPIRESLESALGWLPFLQEESFEMLSPEIVVDVETVSEGGADPYSWATLAAASRYWAVFAVAAGVLAVLGLLLGRGRGRWAAVGLAGLLTSGLGVWVALTAASPEISRTESLSTAAAAALSHVEAEFVDWARPAWWVFAGVCGAVSLIAVSAAAATLPATRVRHGHRLERGRDRPVDWPV